MGEFEAPTSNEKMKRLLGFQERHDWKTEIENEQKSAGQQ
jgi:hypothetical protein